MKQILNSAAVLIAMAPLGLSAQTTVEAGDINLARWSYDSLYEAGAWSVSDFFGAAVYDAAGNEIGDVEDVVFTDSGELLAMIAEIGGFWDIGDTHVSVPWQDVTVHENGRVEVPVTQDMIQEYDVFAYSGLPGTTVGDEIVSEVDDRELGYAVWRASRLIGDYVRIRDETDTSWVNYGYVTDIVARDGEIAATVVNATSRVGGGSVAFPYGGRYYPYTGPGAVGMPAVDIPVLVGDVSSLPSFEPGMVGGR